MQIGVAGLGAMGSAIAARLMEAGHQVTVWNRTAAKMAPLADAGAKVAASTEALPAVVTSEWLDDSEREELRRSHPLLASRPISSKASMPRVSTPRWRHWCAA